jgi:hypothetical protein
MLFRFPLRIFFVAFAASLFSCSSTYRPIFLDKLFYEKAQVREDIKISYANNIQYTSRNKWYAKKEVKFGMVAVAVKVENTSQEIIELSPANLKVFGANGEARRLYTPLEYGNKVKQRTGRHLLHALYGLWINNIFIPVGLVVGIGNAARASKANRTNIGNLDRNAIWNKRVDPGEIVYGTILIAGTHGDELTFVYER